jgi:hypothetical protein
LDQIGEPKKGRLIMPALCANTNATAVATAPSNNTVVTIRTEMVDGARSRAWRGDGSRGGRAGLV